MVFLISARMQKKIFASNLVRIYGTKGKFSAHCIDDMEDDDDDIFFLKKNYIWYIHENKRYKDSP